MESTEKQKHAHEEGRKKKKTLVCSWKGRKMKEEKSKNGGGWRGTEWKVRESWEKLMLKGKEEIIRPKLSAW